MSRAALLPPSPPAQSTIMLGDNNLDTPRLRILPLAPPRWSLGLLRPNVVHLQETEDGQPKRVNVDDHMACVAVAPCRLLLVDQAFLSLLGVKAELCSACRSVAQHVYGQYWAGFPVQ